MSTRKVNQLSDVVVEKVGLVSLGANQETFFLLKSVEEELDMSDTDQEMVQEELVAEPVISEDSLAEKVVAGIKKLLGADEPKEAEVEAEAEADAEQDEPESEEAEVEPELLAEEEVEKSADEKQEQEVESGDAPDEVIEKMSALEKANLDLLDRLEKMEQALLEKNEAVEKQEFIAKAAEFHCVPVAPDVLAEQLYKLHKTDNELFGFWTNLLVAMDKSLSDAGIFSEVGTTQGEVSDKDELIKTAVETGNFDELKKLMLGLDADAAQKIIDGRRAVTKSRVR